MAIDYATRQVVQRPAWRVVRRREFERCQRHDWVSKP